MKLCCIRSFAAKGVREHFRLADAGESHTCEECGQCYAMRENKWVEAETGSVTANVFSPEEDAIDFGWARATRDRDRRVMIVQCWGCGGITEVPDRPYVEMHFDHADTTCTAEKAMQNRAAGRMPHGITH